MNRRDLFKIVAATAISASAFGFAPTTAVAQEVTLRLHQFLPAQANVPAHVLIPWAEKVGTDSGGRIKVEVYSAMELGGKPPELIDQAVNGVVDIVWTLPGYTPGRFPRTEAFELPFTMTNAEATSKAYWDLFESDMKDQDFKGIKILGTWVHGPGVIHAKGDGIRKLEDMQGKKLRGPTRVINALLAEMGSEPIGMPVPAIPEALSKGVIDGTVIPWEVTPSLKIAELVTTHTEFSGDRALYTAAFVLAMNQARYDSLPDDLKKVIDDNSGKAFSASAGRNMQEYDAPGRKIAVDSGNTMIELDQAEVDRWKAAAEPVLTNWYAEMDAKGIDGKALYAKAQDLIAKYSN
ncbi:TRAP-type C4-dicarboxylate transport system substrate-binding protein [Hoeflea marina]|uniref:TRAP-type C4-dicarboxylate transport system substrate-binding protein n=1 Tax=Hoeflea marina TaxID=274592 RepID=A0A317PKB2_9HYPH|nr:TRAP transporter substrate-binding protein [Hoeflea marina]PWV98167.1 TRAP-type C4-dicarboxylate transport system substrate-binding protein [Hoeflea marina]